MALEGYKGAKELELSQDEASLFEISFAQMKKTILNAGFSQEACDLLDFKATSHTLTILPEETGLGGASHTHADGKPFYVLTVSAPDAMTDIAYRVDPDASPTTYSPKVQAFYIAFEIANNISRFMQPVLTQDFGLKDPDGTLTSPATMSPGDPFTVDMPMRCDPFVYCVAFNEILKVRLNYLAQPQATATPPANKQKPPKGPQL